MMSITLWLPSIRVKCPMFFDNSVLSRPFPSCFPGFIKSRLYAESHGISPLKAF